MSAPANTARAIRRALALLEAASADWRARGPSDGSSPLYWPIAVRAARAQLEHALARLEHDDELLRQAAQRLQGWSAGAGPDGKLIGSIEDALGGHSAPRLAGQPDA